MNADSADEVMCYCSGTTRSKIECLFEQGLGMDGISRQTGAASGCAGCEWSIAELLKELAAKQGATATS